MEKLNDNLQIKRRYLFPHQSEEVRLDDLYSHKLSDEKYILGGLIAKKLDKHIVNKTIFNGMLEYSTLLKEYVFFN